jgi:hypothetical protein
MLTTGKPAVGSRFHLTLRFGWRRVSMTYVITRMHPAGSGWIEKSAPRMFFATHAVHPETTYN